MGLEVAGEIVAVGAAVTGLACGRHRLRIDARWWYAEYCKTPVAHCLPIPHGLSVVEAAALLRRFSPSGPTCSNARAAGR